ncbi:transcriptional regulator, partial [Streptomyces sp. SID7982]|nr:transcriptional regulator [Streptomyces sp. SID7982]
MHIDIAGLPADRVVFATSPLAELGLALHALSEPGHHPGLHGWATATAAALEPDLADRMLEAEFLWRNTFSDVFMPFAGVRGGDGQTGSGLAEDLDLLDKLDDERFVGAALEFTCASHYGAGSPSPLDDPAMRERALDLAAARGPQQMDFTRRLLADPGSVRGWIRRLFEDCDQAFFADTWRRVSVQMASDARHKTELLRRKGLADAVGAVSPAVTLDRTGTR